MPRETTAFRPSKVQRSPVNETTDLSVIVIQTERTVSGMARVCRELENGKEGCEKGLKEGDDGVW